MTTTAPEFKVNLPWIESPFFNKELAEAQLDSDTQQLVRQYAEQGFVVFDPQIDEKTLDQVIADLKPKYAENGDQRIQDAWAYSEAVKTLAAAPRVLEVLKTLYRREPIPFQTLNFKLGTQQKTHSDSIHFNSIPQRFMCGVWVALEDVHDGNGPLHYYPASHKMPFYDLIDMGMTGSSDHNITTKIYHQYEDFMQEMITERGLKKQTLNMKKGQAIIWAANLLHGGDQIRQAGTTRLSQVTHYYFSDCMYYVPLLSDMSIERTYFKYITNVVTGEKVKGKYLGEHFQEETNGFTRKFYIPKGLVAKTKAGLSQFFSKLSFKS